MTLNPLEEYVISRQLNDPTDVGTNYVQAVIRNAKTDAIIATVNLVDKGSQRFTKTWQVVSDPTGLGLYITITTIVYTDSGYTTKNTAYGIEQHELLIQDRINPYLGSSGPDIDYKRIQKMIDKALGSIPKAEPKEPDLVPISEGLQAILVEIRAINIPTPEKIDLAPVLEQLRAIKDFVSSITIPETDLSPISAKLTDLEKSMAFIQDAQDEFKNVQLDRIREVFNIDLNKVVKIASELKTAFDAIPYVTLNAKPRDSQKPDVLDDYLKLDQ